MWVMHSCNSCSLFLTSLNREPVFVTSYYFPVQTTSLQPHDIASQKLFLYSAPADNPTIQFDTMNKHKNKADFFSPEYYLKNL